MVVGEVDVEATDGVWEHADEILAVADDVVGAVDVVVVWETDDGAVDGGEWAFADELVVGRALVVVIVVVGHSAALLAVVVALWVRIESVAVVVGQIVEVVVQLEPALLAVDAQVEMVIEMVVR